MKRILKEIHKDGKCRYRVESNRILGFIPSKWRTCTYEVWGGSADAVFDTFEQAQRFCGVELNPIVEEEIAAQGSSISGDCDFCDREGFCRYSTIGSNRNSPSQFDLCKGSGKQCPRSYKQNKTSLTINTSISRDPQDERMYLMYGDNWNEISSIKLPVSSFPDIKWQDGPIDVCVKIEIKKK